MEGLIGAIGETLELLQPKGIISIHGELWKAEAPAGAIGKGQKVRVTAIKDLTLFVEPAQPSVPGAV